jgi:hypothetical protein
LIKSDLSLKRKRFMVASSVGLGMSLEESAGRVRIKCAYLQEEELTWYA